MNVKFSNASLNDLMNIGDHIALENRHRAKTFTAELVTSAEGIAAAPLAFPLVPRATYLNLRRKRHQRYLIFYVVGDSAVEIVRILHGARDYERILFPEDEQP